MLTISRKTENHPRIGSTGKNKTLASSSNCKNKTLAKMKRSFNLREKAISSPGKRMSPNPMML